MNVAWVSVALMLALPAYAADAPSAPAAPAIEEGSKTEVLWEWDPYYSDVSLNIPLTSKPIPTITSDSETEIYRNLIEGSAIPRYMLLEASVYPLPVLGTYLKTHTPGLYKHGQIANGGINVFESVTAGFQEPWAVSAFFGNIAKLVRPGEKRVGNNMGYTGYLFSAGAKHIKENKLIDDRWYEVEWKIKGKREFADEKMGWSFRVGAKLHANPDITDVMYLSIHRSNLNLHYSYLNWLMNSDFDLKAHFSQHGGQVVREEFVVGKKYPMPDKGYTPTLDVGLVWASPDEYSGALRNRTKSTLTFVIRPSIEF